MPVSTTTFTPTIEIAIAKVTIQSVNYLRINQRFEGHHSFEISVSPSMLVGQSNQLRSLAETLVGEPVSISISQTREGAASQKMVFLGTLSSISLVKGQSQTTNYLLSGSGLTTFLETGKTTRSFTNQTLSDIVKNVTGGCSCSPTYTQPIPYVTQYEEDNFHFLQRLAENYGEWMFYNGEELIYGKPSRSNPPVELAYGVNLFDMDYRLRTVPMNMKAQYYNYEESKLYVAPASAESVSGLQTYDKMVYDKSEKLFKDELVELGFQGYKSESDLKRMVKLKKGERSNSLAVLSGSTPEMEIKVGGLIKVKEDIYAVIDSKQGATKQDTVDYGTFVVTSINHSLSGGIYRNYFEAIPHDTDFPPVDYRIIAPQAKPQVATIADTDDPMKLGRVKVHFTWHQNHTVPNTPWVRVLNTMSANSSSYFIPELKSVVMVDFEFGNPDLPFVIGAAYHHNNKPEELFTPDNHLKGIITRGKNHIIIDDTEGKEKISIYNKDKKNKIELSLDGTHISIKSEGDINIEAGGDIKMKAKNIMMEAEKDWKVKADHAVIETQTGDIELIAGNNLSVSAMVDATMVAMSKMAISGITMELEASATAKFTASATLDIDGGGIATLKGGMVMIN